MRSSAVSKLGYALSVLALACSAPAAEPAEQVPAPVAVEKKAAAAPTPVVSDTSFELALQSQPTYTSGQAGTVKLQLSARGGYHVNEDYPLRVDLKAPAALTLEKASLGKPDAAEFGEERARFELGFTAKEPGKHELLATVDFAVCTKETCLPEQRTLAVVLDVQ